MVKSVFFCFFLLLLLLLLLFSFVFFCKFDSAVIFRPNCSKILCSSFLVLSAKTNKYLTMQYKHIKTH